MLSNFSRLKLEIFGKSHSSEIGMVLTGIPKDTEISKDSAQAFVDRRKSGNNAWSTPRHEPDIVEFVSGIKEGKATGEPIRAQIRNTQAKQADYDEICITPRPSHADYVASVKGEYATGGGRFSGRMTAPLCIAGGIAIDILKRNGIEIGAYIQSIGNINGASYKNGEVSISQIKEAQRERLAVLDKSVQVEMERAILEARDVGDSLGGSVECMVEGLPVGLGDALFEGLESRISSAVFAIPAVKGIEFGSGFDLTSMRGSEANDTFLFDSGKVVTSTNHSGGINGGISNGMPLTLRIAVRPTPSISIPQATVDLEKKVNTTIQIKGRHDACIVPRVLPCVEAAVALTLLDALLENQIKV
ncbi:MAG TPA: chorismate synthase [Clostridia bacterium]|nr:chorismate synthase [Clostridia bacterium]